MVALTPAPPVASEAGHRDDRVHRDDRDRRHYSLPLLASALATWLASLAVHLAGPADWMSVWRWLLDAAASAWLVCFVVCYAALVGAQVVRCGLARAASGSGDGPERGPRRSQIAYVPVAGTANGRADSEVDSEVDSEADRGAGEAWTHPHGAHGSRLPWWWATALLAMCAFELLAHAGERNGFLASSRPTAGVEDWTTADGYATLLDGIPAQGDGLFLLSLLGMFGGQGPASPGEFDRRAGHVFLVSLLQRPLGTYWSFAAVNLLSWWAAAMAVWWLGARRWPGTLVPWIGSVLVATGQGFVFMAAAPQPHALAFAAFALALALCDAVGLWRLDGRLVDWLKVGWALGAAGLIYLVHLPGVLFLWLHGLRLYGAGRAGLRTVLAGGVLATAAALAISQAWQVYGSTLLGLTFAGGNNDYAGEALARWVSLARGGPSALMSQLHAGSVRGVFAGAFYYPWWILAGAGLAATPPGGRRWSLAVLVAAAAPAIAFSTRFHLPRLAYFAYPAVYLLAARGIEAIGERAPRLCRAPGGRLAVVAVITALLIALTNADLLGWQRFNVWFHYAQGNTW